MAIKGLTDKGLSFPQIGRIKKGELRPTKKTAKLPKEKQIMAPFDLDYFKVEFADSEEGERLDAKFRAVYGSEPKSINIRLPFNEIVQMWDGFLEAYTASRLLARSDGPLEEGGTVLYRCDGKTGEPIVVHGENIETGKIEPHPEDNIAGYDYQDKPVFYNPIGRLKVIVPELEEAAYMLFTTGSWNDIRFISQQLAGLKELNQEVIKGVPLQLIRSDHEVMAPIKGKKQRVTKSLISIKADPEWVSARIAEDKKLAFPQRILSAINEPGEIVEETETAALSELTHPDNWESDSNNEDTPPPKDSGEPPETSAQEMPDRPYSAEMVREQIQKGIAGYEARLLKDPDTFAIQAEQDRKIVASIVNASLRVDPEDQQTRYAVFEYLLGKGKGSTKKWESFEIGAIKNLWLEVDRFGDILEDIQAQELMNVWNAAQEAQGQERLF